MWWFRSDRWFFTAVAFCPTSWRWWSLICGDLVKGDEDRVVEREAFT